MLKYTPGRVCNVTQFANLREINGKINSVCNFKQTFLGKCCNLRSRPLSAHYGCINAIEFSNGAQRYLASGGDDKRVLLWDIGTALHKPNYKPVSMKETHLSNIFCLGFDIDNSKLFSSGVDEYLLIHDIPTCSPLKTYPRDSTVYAISAHPTNPNIFATASEDGYLRVTDMRSNSQSSDVCFKCCSRHPFHGIAFNPMEPELLGWANGKTGAGLWSIKMPKKILLRYDPCHNAMSVRFNHTGSRLMALSRKCFPGVYETTSTKPIAHFSSESYQNSCTMKSGCFAGENDEYIVSGSDDFKIYLWKIPDSNHSGVEETTTAPQMALLGHRSVVNQVRYNKEMQILASSGVEKIIQMWSPFQYNKFSGTITEPSTGSSRTLYSKSEYIRLILRSGSSLTHEYATQDMEEDPRMIAFFDSLLDYDRERSSTSTDEEDFSTSGSSHSEDDEIAAGVVRLWQQLSDDNRPNSTHMQSNDDLHRFQRMRAEALEADVWESPVGLPATPSHRRRHGQSASTTTTNTEGEVNGDTRLHRSSEDSNKNHSDSLPEASDVSDERSNIKKIKHSKRKKLNIPRETYAKQSTSSDDSDDRSITRKRNAQRPKKVRKKWDVKQSFSDHCISPKEGDPHCSNLTPQSNRQPNQSTSLEEEFPDAYERSQVKLRRSMGETDRRFEILAQQIASAIDDDETSASDDDHKNDKVSNLVDNGRE